MRVPAVAILCALYIASPGVASAASLGDQVSPEIRLTEKERIELEPALAHYYALEGTKDGLTLLLKKSADCGCRDACLTDVVGAVTKAMKSGVKSDEAVKIAVDALAAVSCRVTDKKIAATPLEVGRTVCARIDLAIREKEATTMPRGTRPGGK